MDLEYRVVSGGGHASAPPVHTPVGELAAACKRVEDHPFPMHLTKPAAEMFDTLGRHAGFGLRVVFANLWCFGPVLNAMEACLTRRRAGASLLQALLLLAQSLFAAAPQKDAGADMTAAREARDREAEQILDAYGNRILRLAYSYLHNMVADRDEAPPAQTPDLGEPPDAKTVHKQKIRPQDREHERPEHGAPERQERGAAQIVVIRARREASPAARRVTPHASASLIFCAVRRGGAALSAEKSANFS